MTRRAWPVLLVACALLFGLGGCATVQQARAVGPGAKLDPWENWNRKVFAFNEGLDEHFLKPIATGYSNVVPKFVRRGVDNFFSNAADAWSVVNNILQGKAEPASQDFARVMTNTVFGFLGVLDIASEMGLDHHYEDFGQTLGRWGFGAGAYVVWPLLGPSSVRDSAALPVDRWFASPAGYVNNGRWATGISALQLVNTRANLLGASALLNDIALDKYSFIRDAYLQRRRSLVYDGDAPPTPDTEPPDAPDGPASAPGTTAAPAAPASAASSP